jgi:ketosteroid isomerase-like protein
MASDLYPTAEPRFVGPAEDIEAIRRCHRDWWAANNTRERATIVERASRNFAPETLTFNLNGHAYYGLDEMRKVWEFYVGTIDLEVVHLWDYRIFVHGDLAYITSQGVFPVRASSDQGWGASNLEIGEVGGAPVGALFRETSIARRDDGDGNPVWRIWHFHCSPAAPGDEARPGIGDTWVECGGARGGAVAQTAELPVPTPAVLVRGSSGE